MWAEVRDQGINCGKVEDKWGHGVVYPRDGGVKVGPHLITVCLACGPKGVDHLDEIRVGNGGVVIWVESGLKLPSTLVDGLFQVLGGLGLCCQPAAMVGQVHPLGGW